MSKTLNTYDIVLRPIVTERSNMLSADNNQYVFEVAMNANKVQIKLAIVSIFDVDVLKVNTLVMPKKRARRGRKFYNRKAAWKKAIITLSPGQSIDLFNQ